jgi:hypothetical protein
MSRVMDAMINQHREDAELLVRSLRNGAGVPATLISLESGVPGIDDAGDTKLGDAIRRVRTHLDKFSRQECAAVAYCGYALVDRYLSRNRSDLVGEFPGATFPAPLSIEQILPAECGEWFQSVEEMKRHLEYSNHRSGMVRFLRRLTGL